MQSGAIVPGDTHSAMNEATEKKRTDWTDRLHAACRAWELKWPSREISVKENHWPPSPAVYINVDEQVPIPCDSVRHAASKIENWNSAP
jgi:hypothetical protein